MGGGKSTQFEQGEARNATDRLPPFSDCLPSRLGIKLNAIPRRICPLSCRSDHSLRSDVRSRAAGNQQARMQWN
jgi:hypothetical protein